jgi:hypothetical protein
MKSERDKPQESEGSQSKGTPTESGAERLLLLTVAAIAWRAPLTPSWIWRRVTSSAARHGVQKSATGSAGRVWGLLHELVRMARGVPPAPRTPAGIHSRHLQPDPGREIVLIGRCVAAALICLSLAPYLLYVAVVVPGCYLARILPFLWRAISSGEEDRTARAAGVAATGAIVGVSAGGAAFILGWALLAVLYVTYLAGAGALIAAFVVRFRSQIVWTTRAAVGMSVMPGYPLGNPYLGDEVELPGSELVAGENRREVDPGKDRVSPLALGVFIPTPLEREVEEVIGGTIVPRSHHRFLPGNGLLFAQDAADLLKHVIIQGSIGTGKTTKFILPYKKYLVEELRPHGVGGLIFDFKGRLNPHTGRSGSLNLENGCDQVFALDLGAGSAHWNPLEAGGQGLLESIFGAVDTRSDSAYYHETEIKYGAMLVDVLRACANTCAEHEEIQVGKDREKAPALALPGGGYVRFHPAARHATIDVLDNLVCASKLGEDIAKGIDRLLRWRDPDKLAQRDPVVSAGRRGPEFLVQLGDADWDTWQDYFRQAVGSWVTDGDKGRKRGERVFKGPNPQVRAQFVKNMSGLSNKITQLRKTYGELLDDTDPAANVIHLQDCVDGGKVIGFRLSGGGGESQRMLGKTILRSYSRLIVDEGHERDALSTLLLLDECVTLLMNDEDFASGFLDKARSMGGGAVLAFQYREQWEDNKKTLGNLENNCGTHITLLPVSPREARRLSEEKLTREKVETTERSQSMGITDPQRDAYARTGYSESRQEQDWEHYPPAYLAQKRHEAVCDCYHRGRRYAGRLLAVETNLVREAAERERATGRDVFVAHGDEHAQHEWRLEEQETDEQRREKDEGSEIDFSWADRPEPDTDDGFDVPGARDDGLVVGGAR